MNALKTGIDAQSQIITGEDPEALERLTAAYYDRHQPQGPEEAALIDSAIASDWLLRRLRQTEAQIWNRSITEHAADRRKWGQKAEAYPLAAAFRDQQKVFERLQRRISAAERSLRASLESFARLRKQSGTGLPACLVPDPELPAPDVGQALPPADADVPASSPDERQPEPPQPTPATLSKQATITQIGFAPEILPPACPPAVPEAEHPPVSDGATPDQPQIPVSLCPRPLAESRPQAP
jgi:hypothetical protein